MLKTILKILLGFNGMALTNGLRHGPKELFKSSIAGFEAVRHRNFQLNQRLPTSLTIPEVSLENILGDQALTVAAVIKRNRDGALPLAQAVPLAAIAVMTAPKEIFEIGTFFGDTALILAKNLPSTLVHTIDLPVNFSPEAETAQGIPKDDFHLINSRRVGKEFQGKPEASRIIQHFGDTATWDFSPVRNATFFFIDGAHTYEYCKNDSEKCYDLCNGKGTFLWHDCDEYHPGVLKFLLEWRSAGRNIVRIEGTSLAYWQGP